MGGVIKTPPLSDLFTIEAANIWDKLFLSRRLFILDALFYSLYLCLLKFILLLILKLRFQNKFIVLIRTYPSHQILVTHLSYQQEAIQRNSFALPHICQQVNPHFFNCPDFFLIIILITYIIPWTASECLNKRWIVLVIHWILECNLGGRWKRPYGILITGIWSLNQMIN